MYVFGVAKLFEVVSLTCVFAPTLMLAPVCVNLAIKLETSVPKGTVIPMLVPDITPVEEGETISKLVISFELEGGVFTVMVNGKFVVPY